MKIFKKLLTMVLSITFIVCLSMGIAQAKCNFVNGHIVSQQVAQFSNGVLCPSPIGICTEGRFIGGLKGTFTFIAQTLEAVDSVGVAFTIGDIELITNCGTAGTVVLKDTSAFSLESDGQFGSLETVVGGTGGCVETTGRIRVSGVFDSGCVSCDYRGEICTP